MNYSIFTKYKFPIYPLVLYNPTLNGILNISKTNSAVFIHSMSVGLIKLKPEQSGDRKL